MTTKLAESTISMQTLYELASWLRQDPPPWLTQGPLVKHLEAAFAAHLGRRHAVFVNSGSSANLIGYYALGLLAGHDGRHVPEEMHVLAPAVAWATTVMPPLQFGWDVTLVDADHDTWGISVPGLTDALERSTWSQRTKTFGAKGAEIVSLVHVLGVPADLDAIEGLRKKYRFRLLEDCCAALGSSYHGRRIGSVGDVSTFSFYYGHQLSTIEGGMVVCDDDRIAELLRMTRAHGWAADLEPEARKRLHGESNFPDFNERFTFHVPGFNVRGTDLQAFLGLDQMTQANGVYAARAAAHARYVERLAGSPYGMQRPGPESWVCPIGMGLLADSEGHRAAVDEALRKADIETRPIGGGNMARQPFWRAFDFSGRGRASAVTYADEIHFRGFQVPVHQGMTTVDVDRVCDVLLSVKP